MTHPHEKTPEEDTIKGGHQPYDGEEAEGGAPRGYDSNHERYDENGERIYRDNENAPAGDDKRD